MTTDGTGPARPQGTDQQDGPGWSATAAPDRDDVRAQIRDFLTTRRARITPERAGLPVYDGDRRRVKGLRRSEVAALAGISPEYMTKLERGTVGSVSESVVDGLTHALQLDDAERAHLEDLL